MNQRQQSIDLTKVLGLRRVDLPEEPEDEVLVLNEVSFDEVKQIELENWKKHEVYRAVEDKGQRAISTKWVCTMKQKGDDIVPKARLVARGFEETGN